MRVTSLASPRFGRWQHESIGWREQQVIATLQGNSRQAELEPRVKDSFGIVKKLDDLGTPITDWERTQEKWEKELSNQLPHLNLGTVLALKDAIADSRFLASHELERAFNDHINKVISPFSC